MKQLQETLGATPGLAVVLVGARRDSATYVRMKKKACAEVGVVSFGIDYPADVTQEELLTKIDELNAGRVDFSFFRHNCIDLHICENTGMQTLLSMES